MAHYLPLPYFRPRVQCIVGFRSCEMCPELRSCVRVEADVLASSVPNSPYGLCGRKAALEEEEDGVKFRAQELCESRGGRPGLPVPNSP